MSPGFVSRDPVFSGLLQAHQSDTLSRDLNFSDVQQARDGKEQDEADGLQIV